MQSSYRLAGVTAVGFRTHEPSGVSWTSTGSYYACECWTSSRRKYLSRRASNSGRRRALIGFRARRRVRQSISVEHRISLTSAAASCCTLERLASKLSSSCELGRFCGLVFGHRNTSTAAQRSLSGAPSAKHYVHGGTRERDTTRSPRASHRSLAAAHSFSFASNSRLNVRRAIRAPPQCFVPMNREQQHQLLGRKRGHLSAANG